MKKEIQLLLRRNWVVLRGKGWGELLALPLFSLGFALLVYGMEMTLSLLVIYEGVLLAVYICQMMVTLLNIDWAGTFPPALQLPVQKRNYRLSCYLTCALQSVMVLVLLPLLWGFCRLLEGCFGRGGESTLLITALGVCPLLGCVGSALVLPLYLTGERLRGWGVRYSTVVGIMGTTFLSTLLSTWMGSQMDYFPQRLAELSPVGVTLAALLAGWGMLALSWGMVEGYHRLVGEGKSPRRLGWK